MGGGITGESVRRRIPISRAEEKEKTEVRDGVRAKDSEVRAEKDTREEREKDSEAKVKEEREKDTAEKGQEFMAWI